MSHNLSHALDPRENVPWQNGPQERGGFSILWSSLALVFTCTWTALHLTVPSILIDTWYRSLRRKIKWMIVMVICPEFVFAHAMLDLKMALDDYMLMDKHKDALKRAGWRINVSRGAKVVYDVLSGDLLSASTQLRKHASATGRVHALEAHPGTGTQITYSGSNHRKRDNDITTNVTATTLPGLEAYPATVANISPFDSVIQSGDCNITSPLATSVLEDEASSVNTSYLRPINQSGDCEIFSPSATYAVPVAGANGSSRYSPGPPEPRALDVTDRYHYTRRKRAPPVWTLAHCFFANMGGIRVEFKMLKSVIRYSNVVDSWEPGIWDERSQMNGSSHTINSFHTNNSVLENRPRVRPIVATGDALAESLRPNRSTSISIMQNIRITEEQIRDKSKADTFVRVLWLWQMLRLLVEVIFRAARDYPIAQLEIITLSFAALSLAIVLVQSQKPQDIREPMSFPIPGLIDELDFDAYDSRIPSSLSARFLVPGKHFSFPIQEYVPNDYCRTAKDNNGNDSLFFIMFGLSTVFFGLIHCGAWNFNFPTLVEKWLWRGCTIASISIPLLILAVTQWMQRRHKALEKKVKQHYRYLRDPQGHLVACEWYSDRRGGRKNTITIYDSVTRIWDGYCKMAQNPGMAVYFFTRMIIIGIALSCLRSAPRGMYWGTWTNFLPAMK
jgi:hypothetical protein